MTNVKQTLVTVAPAVRDLKVGDFVREYKRDLYMVVSDSRGKFNIVAVSGDKRGFTKFGGSSYDTLVELERRLKHYGDMSLVEVSELEVKISSEVLY